MKYTYLYVLYTPRYAYYYKLDNIHQLSEMMDATTGDYDAWEYNLDLLQKAPKDSLTVAEKVALQLQKGFSSGLVVHNNPRRNRL